MTFATFSVRFLETVGALKHCDTHKCDTSFSYYLGRKRNFNVPDIRVSFPKLICAIGTSGVYFSLFFYSFF